MLLITVLPLCLFAEKTVKLHVSGGGTDVRYSPTINYLRYVFLPLLEHMGITIDLEVHSYGYYPKGGGEVTLTVHPCESSKPLKLTEFNKIQTIQGISVCTFLADRKVAERQAKAADNYLQRRGHSTDIQVINDESNPIQKGSSLVLWTKHETSVPLGADAIGERGKSSEKVGKEAAKNLHAEISAKPTVDLHMADLLVPYAALAEGKSVYLTRRKTDHLETNIWLAEKMLDVHFEVKKTGTLYRITKLP